ncbi:MAG: 4-carboxy-4-hydroxy-2-oxoadipate aldolase/oxaloacetate decarboxylase [Synergistetes bacterium]|nr:4-carboxy-4-hydroxy-2-oxoadipate aldolase/oxaloacetate decarboxylase [Synergistota bacterium]MCX8127569.1 4-carboxy-4-hydroxy-2-oxoadipate aldolase/oxaloacetate decarboxylase [Synergistota bacterium]MDW8191514.1 4-carboxy-4-hydroxy-2-oxoadipate aldolase/oxaloacetate decarboxylase [Synergistota bacterium]
MIHVIKSFRRPEKEIISAFKSLSSATVYEAAGRKGAVSNFIRPIYWGMKLCGSAITVQCAPGDNLMLHKALEVAEEGDVIVAVTSGAYEYGYWGELMTVSAMAKGIAGLVIDGCIRDSEEIVSMGFPIFCRGFSIRGTSKEALGLINYPLSIGGVVVNAGDLVLGDNDGVVVIKREEAGIILEKALKRVADENKKREVLKTGVSSVEYNNLREVLERLGLREE